MSDLKLVILSGRPDHSRPSHPSYDLAYSHFKQTWERICNRPNRPPNYSGFGFFAKTISYKSNPRAKSLAKRRQRTTALTTLLLKTFLCLSAGLASRLSLFVAKI